MTPATWCAIGVGALAVFVGIPLWVGRCLAAANDHDFDLLNVPMGDELDELDELDDIEIEITADTSAFEAAIAAALQHPVLERTVLAQAEFDAQAIPFVREVDPSDVVLNDRIARARLADHESVLDRAFGPETQLPKGDR